MGEHRAIRIDSRLCSVFRHTSPCQDITVPVRDLAPHHLLGKRVLPLVIRAVDKRIGSDDRKIYQISHKSDE